MMEAAAIAVIIPVKNELGNLHRCLAVICQQQTSLPYEIWIIDSGSTDGTVGFVRGHQARWPHLRLVQIQPSEFHHARTRNYGARLAQGDIVVFLAGDAEVRDDRWLDQLTRPVRTGAAEGIIAAYGRQIPRPYADVGNRWRMTVNYGDTSFIKHQASRLSLKELYFFSTVNACLDRRTIPGPIFDEAFPVNEDVTLSRRLIERGHKIAYVAEAAVVHSHNYGAGEIFQRYFDNGVTYRNLGIFKSREASLAKDGAKYSKQALAILRHRPLKDWWQFGQFFFFAGLGVQLGTHYHWLPRSLARRCSKYGTV